MGVVSSIGIGKDDFRRNLIDGKSGISEVERFDTSKFTAHRGGEVKDFSPESFMPRSRVLSSGRGSQLAIASTALAVEDGMLDLKDIVPGEMGIIIGTTMGEAPSIEMIDRYWTEKSEEDVYSSNVLKFPVNNLSDNAASTFGLKAYSYVIPTACAAGNYSIGYAFDLIRTGSMDLMLSGGADPLSRLAYTGFSRLFAMAPEMCQPFDRNRRGMMPGEGGAILMIENLEHAEKRNAHIYAEYLGGSFSLEGWKITVPNMADDFYPRSFEKALDTSGLRPGQIGFVNPHGMGMKVTDTYEAKAINRVFGTSKPLVSAFKPLVGHNLGGSALDS